MAFISIEQTKQKRNLLKKEFPAKKGWKFSITNVNYSKIRVVILQAPFQLLENYNLDKGYESTHNYCFDDFHKEKKDVLTKIHTIINKDNFDKSDSQTDYFHVGFYTDISIGDWERKFIVKSMLKNCTSTV